MDFDSPDVEKEFPGLYASETGKKDDDECKFFFHTAPQTYPFLTNRPHSVSEGDHEKISKKELLLGRRKDKKDKKDRGYAALDGESSPDEDVGDTK